MSRPTDDGVPHAAPDEGGEAACWLDQVCPECGAVDGHRADCPEPGPTGT